MKVLAALALVQIAGIVGTAIAQEQNGNSNSRLLHGFQAILRKVNATRFESIFLNNTESTRSKCETNGGSKAHDTAMEAAQIYINSFMAQRNATQLQVEAIVDGPNNGINSAIEPICQFITNVNDIIRTYADSLRVCWTQPERNSFDLMNNVTVAVSRFMCENGSNHISAFLENDASSCLYSKIQNGGIERCTHYADFIGNVPLIESNNRTVHFPWSVPIVVPKTANCIEFLNFRRCIISTVQGCAPPNLLTEINFLFNILLESSTCKSLLRAHGL